MIFVREKSRPNGKLTFCSRSHSTSYYGKTRFKIEHGTVFIVKAVDVFYARKLMLKEFIKIGIEAREMLGEMRAARSGDDGGLLPLIRGRRHPLLTGVPQMKLIFIGRQGLCRYYWRVFRDGTRVMYAKVDGGILQPVAY